MCNGPLATSSIPPHPRLPRRINVCVKSASQHYAMSVSGGCAEVMSPQTAASEDASRPGGRTYSFRGHCGGLLAGLDSLRRRRLLFDATLVVGGVEYGVHRAVLAACSDYFRSEGNETSRSTPKYTEIR